MGITFGACWPAALTLQAMGFAWGGPESAALWRYYTLVPAFAALLVKGAIAKEPVLESLGLVLKPNRWWLIAWMGPVVMVGAIVVLSPLWGPAPDTSMEAFRRFFEPHLAPDQVSTFRQEMTEAFAGPLHPILRMVLQAMVSGITLGAVSALGEELGWRGFLHHELPRTAGTTVRSAVAIGCIWGLWHFPVVLLGHPYGPTPWGYPTILLWCIAASLVLSPLRARAGSIIPVAIAMGTVYSLQQIPAILLGGGGRIVHGVQGLASTALLFAVAFVTQRRSIKTFLENTFKPRDSAPSSGTA